MSLQDDVSSEMVRLRRWRSGRTSSGSAREAAQENRQRILDALHELLREAPAEPISVDDVARRARVARSTIYLAFGSRNGLFDALTVRLLTGEGFRRILAAVRHPDPRETLRGGWPGASNCTPHITTHSAYWARCPRSTQPAPARRSPA